VSAHTSLPTPARAALSRALRIAVGSRSVPRTVTRVASPAPAARSGLGAQARPQSRIVAAPGEEAEIIAREAGRPVAAISAASMHKVPEPHIGSRNSAPCAASSGQPLRSNTPAADVFFSGASPPAPR